MRRNFKANNMLFPMPVLILSTYNEDGSVDCMNAAWGTMEDHDVVDIQLASDHLTSKNILSRKAFTVSFCDAKNVEPGDYVGLVSGNEDSKKFEKTLWHATKSAFVDAPVIEELPICLECELERISQENGDFEVFGRIRNISVREDLINSDGKLNLKKANLITYSSYDHSYYSIGEKIATAFSVGLKRKA